MIFFFQNYFRLYIITYRIKSANILSINVFPSIIFYQMLNVIKQSMVWDGYNVHNPNGVEEIW